MKKTQLLLITLLSTLISAKRWLVPRRIHNSVQKSDPYPHDAYAKMYAKIRAKTRQIARKLQREKLYALKTSPANNFGAMDLAESRRLRKIQAKLKKVKTAVVEPKRFFDVDEFMKERNTYREKQRKELKKLKSHGKRSVMFTENA